MNNKSETHRINNRASKHQLQPTTETQILCVLHVIESMSVSDLRGRNLLFNFLNLNQIFCELNEDRTTFKFPHTFIYSALNKNAMSQQFYFLYNEG